MLAPCVFGDRAERTRNTISKVSLPFQLESCRLTIPEDTSNRSLELAYPKTCFSVKLYNPDTLLSRLQKLDHVFWHQKNIHPEKRTEDGSFPFASEVKHRACQRLVCSSQMLLFSASFLYIKCSVTHPWVLIIKCNKVF